MASRPSPTGQTWPGAAHALARRVNRRTRWAAVLHRVGWTLLVAALIAVAWRALGGTWGGLSPRSAVGIILGLGLIAALWPAWRAARAVPPVSEADAAWALDRLANAQGRGLAAAAAQGPAASEAAHAGGGVKPPPTPRLLPPTGLLPIVGAGLLAAVAFLAPVPAGEDEETAPAPVRDHAASDTASGTAIPGASEATQADREAGALEARAKAAEAVRRALGLPAEGPVDAEEIEARLQDPTLREAAQKAADEAVGESGLAAALGEDAPSADSVARMLAQSDDHRSLASERRRAAAKARARLDHMPLPPSRRPVVERYLVLRDRR